MYYSAIVWVWMGGADLSRSFGGLTGGRGLHTRRNYTVFCRFGVFNQRLGSIHLIIVGFSYVTCLGWVFSRFSSASKAVAALMRRIR